MSQLSLVDFRSVARASREAQVAYYRTASDFVSRCLGGAKNLSARTPEWIIIGDRPWMEARTKKRRSGVGIVKTVYFGNKKR